MRRMLLCLMVCGCALGAGAGAALAGGWAATSLDTLAATPRAGTPADVAFTVRQHGVTPVTIDDVAIEIVARDGAVTRFAARAQEAEGRYVARVTFPRAGTWRWRVVQGWFGPQELGTVEVRSAPVQAEPAGGGASTGWWTAALLVTGIVGAMGFAALALARGRGARAGDGRPVG